MSIGFPQWLQAQGCPGAGLAALGPGLLQEAWAHTRCMIAVHPSSEIMVYCTISEIVYQNIALDQMGGLEIAKMVKE